MSEFSLIKERINEGKALLSSVRCMKCNGKTLPGSVKLINKIKAELRFLSKIVNGQILPKPCYESSTNLSSLNSIIEVVNIVETNNVSQLLQIFKDDCGNPLCVDVVVQGGHIWIKVVARNASALYASWKGRGQFGERNIMDIAEDYIRTAKCNPIHFLTPKVVFCFTSGIPVGLAQNLSEAGIMVNGKFFKKNSGNTSPSDDNDEELNLPFETTPLTELIRKHDASFDLNPHTTKVNLDISSMLTVISNLSNGFDHFVFGIPVLDEQVKQEQIEKVLPKICKFLEGKSLIACETAVTNFKKIVGTIGGVNEKRRADEFLKKVTVVQDSSTSRTLNLMTSSKLNKRAKIIFGTGDAEQVTTLTANRGFVRAALQHGVKYSVYLHEPRALTEIKEIGSKKLPFGNS